MHSVFATWNGIEIIGPLVIYQDEILVKDNGTSQSPLNVSGSLVCRSDDQQDAVGWRTPSGAIVSTTFTGDFRQKRYEGKSISRLSINRAGISRDDLHSNGLWTCRLSGSPDFIFVGMYGRGELPL